MYVSPLCEIINAPEDGHVYFFMTHSNSHTVKHIFDKADTWEMNGWVFSVYLLILRLSKPDYGHLLILYKSVLSLISLTLFVCMKSVCLTNADFMDICCVFCVYFIV